MATYTSNYAWTKPSGNDNVDISVLNANLDSQDSIMHDAFMNMAQAFSESSTYEVGDIVVYGTTTYKCHTAVTTAGSWTGSTNWQVYKLSEGGGGGLTLGETSSTAYRGDRGKTAYEHSQTTGNPHGTTAADVGLGNVPNVSTNNQTPTFTQASTRNNIASGEKLSVIFGKIQKFFNDLKTVAFSGSYTDLSNKPTIPTTASGISYDNTDSGLTATDVQGALDELQGYRVLNSVTADGIKTYKELINALFDGVVIDDNQTIIVKVINSYYYMMYNSIRYKEFGHIMVENGHLRARDLNYDNQLTGTHLEESDTTVSGTTFNYLSNTAVTQGHTLTLLAR